MPTLRHSLGHSRSAYPGLAGSARVHFTSTCPALSALYQSLAKTEFGAAPCTGPSNMPCESYFQVEVFHRDQPVAFFRQPAADIKCYLRLSTLPAFCCWQLRPHSPTAESMAGSSLIGEANGEEPRHGFQAWRLGGLTALGGALAPGHFRRLFP